MSQPSSEWPNLELGDKGVKYTSEEERRVTGMTVNVHIYNVIPVDSYSKLTKLLRVTAWVRLFVYNALVT